MNVFYNSSTTFTEIPRLRLLYIGCVAKNIGGCYPLWNCDFKYYSELCLKVTLENHNKRENIGRQRVYQSSEYERSSLSKKHTRKKTRVLAALVISCLLVALGIAVALAIVFANQTDDEMGNVLLIYSYHLKPIWCVKSNLYK
jgi:hypothetical protein